MNSSRRVRAIALLISLVLTALGLVAVATPAQAATATGTITGVVKSADGAALNDKTVTLYRNVYDEELYTIAKATTDANGAFTFKGVKVLDPSVPDIRYRVTVTDPKDDFLSDSVEPVVVKKGATTKVAISMRKAASISGKISRADGKSPKGIVVNAWEGGTAVADANGNYRVKGLSYPATFELRYEDPSGDYLYQCFDDVLADLRFEFGCETDADPGGTAIETNGPDNTVVKDQVLSRKAGHITGKVTDTKNRVIKGARLDLFNVDSGDAFYVDPPIVSGADGSFRINGIPPGTWVLRSTTCCNGDDLGWAEYWWKDATSWAEATPLKVTAGNTISGLAIKMKSQSTITVKSTPGTDK